MNGLHSCKPGNEPQVGQIKTFVVQQMTGKSGKPYTKIKAANAENGGTPYKILSAKPTGHTDSYGNISFNIEVEPASGGLANPPQRDIKGGALGADWTSERSQSNGDSRSSRIERQHSQEMAIRYAALKELKDITTSQLLELTNWFQRDVSHVPEAPSKVERPVEPTLPEDHDEEPF